MHEPYETDTEVAPQEPIDMMIKETSRNN